MAFLVAQMVASSAILSANAATVTGWDKANTVAAVVTAAGVVVTAITIVVRWQRDKPRPKLEFIQFAAVPLVQGPGTAVTYLEIEFEDRQEKNTGRENIHDATVRATLFALPYTGKPMFRESIGNWTDHSESRLTAVPGEAFAVTIAFRINNDRHFYGHGHRALKSDFYRDDRVRVEAEQMLCRIDIRTRGQLLTKWFWVENKNGFAVREHGQTPFVGQQWPENQETNS